MIATVFPVNVSTLRQRATSVRESRFLTAMFTREQYELIDFGDGRRLERMGELVLDRPCPSAREFRRGYQNAWRDADVRFVEHHVKERIKDSNPSLGTRGVWEPLTSVGARFFTRQDDLPHEQRLATMSSRPWILPFSDKFVFELKGSPFGHVGVFPEQSENWTRIDELCREGEKQTSRPLRILNLFGYTGGSALAAAAAGAEVTHLDAAKNIVAQAKRNAIASFGTDDNDGPDVSEERLSRRGTIRWIVDDAVKFVKREERRGAEYHGVILDPPSYGHGARGEVWRLSRDLEPLLERCVNLLSVDFNFTLLTGHTPGFEYPTLARILRQAYCKRFNQEGRTRYLVKPLGITARSGAILPAGDMALATFRK